MKGFAEMGGYGTLVTFNLAISRTVERGGCNAAGAKEGTKGSHVTSKLGAIVNTEGKGYAKDTDEALTYTATNSGRGAVGEGS